MGGLASQIDFPADPPRTMTNGRYVGTVPALLLIANEVVRNPPHHSFQD